MKKLKVVGYSKTCGLSGSDRTNQLLCQYLKELGNYEPFLVYRVPDAANCRVDAVEEILGKDHVIPYFHEHAKNPQPPYWPKEHNLDRVLAEIQPDIFHIHRSGYKEFPGFKSLLPTNCKLVETNIFGYVDSSPDIDINIYISEFIRNRAMSSGGRYGPVLYNPVEAPYLRNIDLKKEFRKKHGLPMDAIVLGRVGRPDNFDPISLKAFQLIERDSVDVYYFIVNGCEAWRKTAKDLNLKNVRFLEPIYDSGELSLFYQSIDIYAHARHDGECCPCNIQEAMIHGLPVVTHTSQLYNGQSEILGDDQFVVEVGDHTGYAGILDLFIENPDFRDGVSRKNYTRAIQLFDAWKVTQQLERIYDDLYV